MQLLLFAEMGFFYSHAKQQTSKLLGSARVCCLKTSSFLYWTTIHGDGQSLESNNYKQG